MPSTLSHLECSRPACGQVVSASERQNLCTACKAPLLARYDLAAARETLSLEALTTRTRSMWRYEEVLPGASPVTLGEGMTPLLHTRRLGQHLGLEKLFIKDEGLNPTSSFKARGLSAAVTMARGLGVETIALPTSRQCRRRGSRLCGPCRLALRDRHAVGHARGQHHRVPRLRRRRPSHRRPDLGLRHLHRRAGGEERLVRGLHAEGALSHRRQEDDGDTSSGRTSGAGCRT